MAGDNRILEGLRVKLARMQSGQEPGGKLDTSIIQGMIKALEKADAEAAKKAAAAPPVVEFLDEVEVEPVQSPLKLCLFDLDDTLLRTTDLDQFRGQANVGRDTGDIVYRAKLATAFGDPASRFIYSPAHHAELRAAHPQMKWGVFTRAPRVYAETLLSKAYPGMPWDVLVAYEDVRNTKPHGDGVWAAMRHCNVQYVDQVALVGDDKNDIQAAYQGGCWTILDQSSWERPWASPRYWAMERIPDAVIADPSVLVKVLAHPKGFLPDLEYISDAEASMTGRRPRVDTINHFFPRPDNGYVPIHCLGRLFGEYKELRPRRQWHALTDEILAHKDASKFPNGWGQTLKLALYRAGAAGDCTVTVIPFKPGRPPRLEALLDQLRRGDVQDPFREGVTFKFEPALLAFRDGAVSSHGRHLNREERFANVRENLYVAQPERVRGRRIVVIDDVTTTGATLLWAHRYLSRAGAQSVTCISLAKAVSIG